MTRYRRRASAASVALTLAALSLGLARSGAAQVIISSNGATTAIAAHTGTLPISDEAVRSMIASHQSATLRADSPDNYVVLVVDANSEYMSSRTTRATTVVPGEGGTSSFNVTTTGDTVAVGSVVVRRRSGEAVDAGAITVVGAPTMFMRSNDGAMTIGESGIMGTGIRLTDVSSIGMKRYAAGELGEAQLFVTVLKLK